MRNDKITLVMVSNNHLVVMLGALLKSIELSHSHLQPIDIYIVNDGISRKNVERINQTVSSTLLTIHWKNIKDVIPSDISFPIDYSTYPLCIYVRLLLPYFLPPHVNKAIYLDVDMIVLKDIKRLWDIELANKGVGAVVDISEKVSSTWGGIRNYKELGLAPESKYFNSGLLVVNVEKWRQQGASLSVLNVIRNNSKYAIYPDQYGLNVIFANDWLELDSRWNNYSQKYINDPFIIHFTETKPIYKHYNFSVDYRDIFFRILDLTPWSGFTPQSSYMDHMKKFWNLVTKGRWNILIGKIYSFNTNKVS